MRRLIYVLLGAILMFAGVGASAQTDAAREIAELRAQVDVLLTRLERLEEQSAVAAALPAAASAPPPVAANWTDSVRVAGDFRYRHETINDDVEAVQDRHRIRARITVTADIAENMTAGFGLSTGGATNDSGNQTLDGGFSYKDIGLDLAYFNWAVSDDVNLIAGKMSNPFYRPSGYHLIYDGDIRPEGLAVRYSSGNFFGNAAAFWVEERGSSADSALVGLQGGYRGALDNGVGFTAGASYYEATHAQGSRPFFTSDDGQGNQLDADGNYLYGFSEIEFFGELRFRLNGQPLTVFADYVVNQDAAAFDEGYAVGATYRRASNPGDWSFGYVYQDLEANAVIGAFTDSDFAGGTSDGTGHSLLANYVFPGGWNFGFRYIIGDRGEAEGNQRDYNRLQADISMRY